MRYLRLLLPFTWTFLWSLWAFAAEGDVGIVLMHGKGANPPSVMRLAGNLESKGYRVTTPIMAWSSIRGFDADYPRSLIEIGAAVKSLRDKGAKRIILAGHSLGANAAIAYAGSGHDIDGIIAIAPGHVPDVPRFRTAVAGSLKKARQMIAEGQSDSSASFLDLTRGTTRTITTTAAIYLSYFDPEGLAAMPKSAAAIPRPSPFLWIIGNQDPLLVLGDNYVFNKAPKHPRSSYLVVPGGHGDTPNVGAAPIIDWLASLGY